MKFRRFLSFLILVLIAALGFAAYEGKLREEREEDAATSSSLLSSLETGVIVNVIDGDTVTVLLDGENRKVRLLEVDAPESAHYDVEKNSPFGETAAQYAKSRLPVGQTVYLSKDVSETDRYGRLLRLIWTERPDDIGDEEELRSKCFNAQLLLDGMAVTAIYEDPTYETLFRKFEKEAAKDRRGLWAEDAWWEFLGREVPDGSLS